MVIIIPPQIQKATLNKLISSVINEQCTYEFDFENQSRTDVTINGVAA